MDNRWLRMRRSGVLKAMLDSANAAAHAPIAATAHPGGLPGQLTVETPNPPYNQPMGGTSIAIVGAPTICSCYPRHHYEDGRAKFFGILAALILILLIAALLAGLTLGLTGLDITWLNVMSTTGPEKKRKQAQKVARIKRHGTWFLCDTGSMLLVSVLCIEIVPILTLSLFGATWLPVFLCFIGIFFFVELLPQFLIPRQPLYWGYYCRYLIWGCLCATALITYPLSWVLDRCTIPKHEKGIYGNEQLAQLVKYHERKEKHGGNLGPDAGRIMRGAIELDGRTMEKAYSRRSLDNGISKLDGADDNVDVEKSAVKDKQSDVRSEIIVPWTAVKYILVDEEVNEAFMAKVREWAYSRLPVVGNAAGREDSTIMGNAWNGKKVFGFLHIKNLLGVDVTSTSHKRLFVRDIPLYPLPIVRDDLPIFDLLNMFQLGMARMAIIINAPARDSKDWLATTLATTAISRPHNSTPSNPLWHVNRGLSRESETEVVDKVDWTTDFIEAAKAGAARLSSEHPETLKMDKIVGIGCPEPLGIVTFEDIIDLLMQKTSCDEKDFFDRKGKFPLTKRRKEGDFGSVRSSKKIYRSPSPGARIPKWIGYPKPANAVGIHGVSIGSDGFRIQERSSLRRRTKSGQHSRGLDGVDDEGVRPGGVFGMDGQHDDDLSMRGRRYGMANDIPLTALHSRSEYTTNSMGGFHGDQESADSEFSTMAQRAVSVNHKLRRFAAQSKLVASSNGSTPKTSLEESPRMKELRAGLTEKAKKINRDRNGEPLVGRMYEVPKYSREVFSSLEEVPMASEAGNGDEKFPSEADIADVAVESQLPSTSIPPTTPEKRNKHFEVTYDWVRPATPKGGSSTDNENENMSPIPVRFLSGKKILVGDRVVDYGKPMTPEDERRALEAVREVINSPTRGDRRRLNESGSWVEDDAGNVKAVGVVKNSGSPVAQGMQLIEPLNPKKRTPTKFVNGVRVSPTGSLAESEGSVSEAAPQSPTRKARQASYWLSSPPKQLPSQKKVTPPSAATLANKPSSSKQKERETQKTTPPAPYVWGSPLKKRTPTRFVNGVRVSPTGSVASSQGSSSLAGSGSEAGEGSDKENLHKGPMVVPVAERKGRLASFGLVGRKRDAKVPPKGRVEKSEPLMESKVVRAGDGTSLGAKTSELLKEKRGVKSRNLTSLGLARGKEERVKVRDERGLLPSQRKEGARGGSGSGSGDGKEGLGRDGEGPVVPARSSSFWI